MAYRGFFHRMPQSGIDRAFAFGRPVLVETRCFVAEVGRAMRHDVGIAVRLQLSVLTDHTFAAVSWAAGRALPLPFTAEGALAVAVPMHGKIEIQPALTASRRWRGLRRSLPRCGGIATLRRGVWRRTHVGAAGLLGCVGLRRRCRVRFRAL